MNISRAADSRAYAWICMVMFVACTVLGRVTGYAAMLLAAYFCYLFIQVCIATEYMPGG